MRVKFLWASLLSSWRRNGYKSGEVEVRVAPRPGPKPLPLFIEPYEAMMELLREADRLDLDLQPAGDADDPGLP